MAFQIKSFVDIVLAMVNKSKATQSKVTDFRVGSIARTMFEAPAAEIDELYQQMWIGLKEAIPTAIYNTFDFDKIKAIPASGTVRVNISPSASATLIAAGSTFKAAGYSGSFTSLADVTIASGGSYGDVYVSYSISGVVGNIPAGTAFTVSPSITGFLSASAISSFTTGADEETDDARKARFARYVLTLNRGTVSALKYGLSLANVTDAAGNVTEQVKFAQVIEPYILDSLQPVALVNCYIHNGVSGASSTLIANAAKVVDGYTDSNGAIVPGWKAAGVKVVVMTATSVSIPLTGVVTVDAGYTPSSVVAAVTSAMSDYIYGLGVGDSVLRAELISAAMGVDGVINITLSAPSGDTAISATQKAITGTVTLTSI